MSIAPDKLVQLRILQRQYLQLVDPSQLRWPDAQVLKSSGVQSWIFLHIFDESSVKSPPPERYRLRVLKLLISKLERSIVDPEEDVRFPVSSSFLSSYRSCGNYTLCRVHSCNSENVPRCREYKCYTTPAAADRLLFQRVGNLR